MKPNALRPEFFSFENGVKAQLPFTQTEYDTRLTGLRKILRERDVHAAVLTSMHAVAYYLRFLYCSFGRPYACGHRKRLCHGLREHRWWATLASQCTTTLSTPIGNARTSARGQQAATRRGSVLKVTISPRYVKPNDGPSARRELWTCLTSMRQRMTKSTQERELIRSGARVVDIGGQAIWNAIAPGLANWKSQAGRAAMEAAIAEMFPDSEMRDTWVWFQSGLNTDGAQPGHQPVPDSRGHSKSEYIPNDLRLLHGARANPFSWRAGLESLCIWEANVEAHELGLSLTAPARFVLIFAMLSTSIESMDHSNTEALATAIRLECCLTLRS